VTDYEWDLDGNGSYETDTGANSHAARIYPNHGTIAVRVRVTDNDGAKSVASATLVVSDPMLVAPLPGGGSVGTGTGSGGASPGTGGSSATGGSSTGSSGSSGANAGETLPGPMRASLDGPAVQIARTIVKSGLTLTCQADREATCAIQAEVNPTSARKLGLRVPRRSRPATGIPIGSATVQARAGDAAAVRVSITPKARRRLRRARGITVTVRALVTDTQGQQAQAARVIVIAP
jgi:hypothetical protein